MLPASGQMVKLKLHESIGSKEWKSAMIGTKADTFLITIPAGFPNPHTSLRQGTIIEVEYHGRDGAKLTFRTTIVRTSFEPPQLELRTPQPTEIRREQRREFVRVPAGLPVRIELPANGHRRIFDVYMRDLSGGGLALLIPPEITSQIGNQLKVHFTIPKIDAHIDTKCTLVRVSERSETGFTVWSLMFADMKESARQKIIQYTFMRQRQIQDINKDMSTS